MSFEQIMLRGNVGQEPEQRFTADGTPVTNFSLAVNRSYTLGDGTKRKETKWFRISCWRRLAEVVKDYVHKGDSVLVTGRMSGESRDGKEPNEVIIDPRVWQGSDGEYHASFEVTAQNVDFCGGNGGTTPVGPPAGEETEDIPF